MPSMLRRPAGQVRELAPVDLARLQNLRQELERGLKELDAFLAAAGAPSSKEASHNEPRISPLDNVRQIVTATRGLRTKSGKLSADRIVRLYGISLSDLAKSIGRSKQSISKTPDAESLQPALSFFERTARLLMIATEEDFRKWLRTPQPALNEKGPLDVIAQGGHQIVADLVDDMLTGSPG